MEKLIELLNEFEKEERNHPTSRTYEYNWFHYIDYWMIYSEFLMLSKKYWFIKWLVDNDKIDWEKMWRFKAERKNTQIIAIANKSDFYLSLLMLLSISNSPIEDLCGYLKDDATEKVDTLLKGIKKSCESLWI